MTVPVPDQLEYISDADGVTKDFPYPKRFLQKDEIVVLLRDADGVDTPQILNTHYTIAGSSWPSGGTISFVAAPVAPNKVVRYRMTQAKQTVDLENNQRNDAPSVELQLDRLTMAIQDRGRLGDSAWWGLLTEIAARVQGDKLLNDRVDQEIIDRTDGDDALRSLIGQAGPIEVPQYDTRLAASLATIKPGVKSIQTGGYISASDLGAARYYQKAAIEADAKGDFTSNGGTIRWGLNERRPTPEMFGAKGDGSTDDTLAIRDFFANRMKAGCLPQGQRYRVTGTTDIPSGFNLYSDGATILATEANIVQLRSVDTSDVIVKGRLIVKGPGKANAGGIGLRLGGNSRCLFSGVSIRDIDGWGFYISGGAYDAVSWYDKNQFADCSAYNCYTGREDTPNTLPNLSNEYSTWMDFHAGGCVVGNKTSAGNNSFIGGKLIGNDYNLSIAQGANSAHGTFTGVQINHAGVDNLVCVGASSGLLFVGCTFFGDSPTVGSLRFSNSRGIILSGCLVEASIFSDGAFNSIILDGYYTNNNFVPIHGGTHPQTIYKKNGFDTGGRHAFADEGYDYVSAYRSTNQALTSGADTVIVYDTISNSKNLRGKYNVANGQYTAPWTGVYRVSASMKLTGTVSGGGIKLKRGAGDLAYSGLTDYSGVKVATISADIFCNAGDIITAVANVTGTSLNVSPAPNANLTILAL